MKLTNVNQRVNYLTNKYRNYQGDIINGKKIHKLDVDLVFCRDNKTEILNIAEISASNSDDELILRSIPEQILHISIHLIHKNRNENQNEKETPPKMERREIFEGLEMNTIFHHKGQFEFEFMKFFV